MKARDDLKRLAAEAAVAEVEDRMVVGLGTGSTAAFAIEALARRVGEGLKITGIPTSEASASLARKLGIDLSDLDRTAVIDLTIDGADEVERGSLALIKGLGGALLREKIVAAASRRMIVVVDEGKLVDRLGSQAPLPVEIVAFGAAATLNRLAGTVAKVELRMAGDTPFVTDGGNWIADCGTGPIDDPVKLERDLSGLVGVVESGLFVGLASRVVVGTAKGVQTIDAGMRASS